MNDQQEKEKPPFAHQAAKFSWLAPLLGMIASAAMNNTQKDKYEFGQKLDPTDHASAIVMTIGLLFVAISGLVLGFMAMRHVKTLGRKKIFVPALVGMALNTLILAAIVVIALAAVVS